MINEVDSQEATTSACLRWTMECETKKAVEVETAAPTLPENFESVQRMDCVSAVLEEVLCDVERIHGCERKRITTSNLHHPKQFHKGSDREERRMEKSMRKGTAFFLQMLRANNDDNKRAKKETVVEQQREGDEEGERRMGANSATDERVGRIASSVPCNFSESKRPAEKIEDGRDVAEKPEQECWLGGKADESGTKRAKIELDFANLQLLQRESAAFSVEAQSFGFSVGTSCNNYLKCCKWNADGRLLVTSSQDRHVRLFELNEAENQVTLIRSIPLGDLIYEVCWHPSKDWLVTSSKDHPIHIWDRDGSRVLSFRGINHLDELSSAYSLCFSLDGRYLYGGYKKVIRVFDMASCGRQNREIPTWKKKIGGQKGIISCVAMNPAVNGVYAAGCYGKQLAVYSDLTASAVCIFDTPSSATTHIRYSPDGNRLFAAARKDDIITCWDLRFVGQVLGYLRRPSSTNQRIYFEMDSLGRYLLSGSTCGDVHVFSLSELKDEPTDASSVIRAHRSAVVGVSLHPSGAILATCSGQRIFPMPSVDADLSEDENCYEALSLPDQLDNSLCLWGAHGKRVL